jgi:hypothetical protein
MLTRRKRPKAALPMTPAASRNVELVERRASRRYARARIVEMAAKPAVFFENRAGMTRTLDNRDGITSNASIIPCSVVPRARTNRIGSVAIAIAAKENAPRIRIGRAANRGESTVATSAEFMKAEATTRAKLRPQVTVKK